MCLFLTTGTGSLGAQPRPPTTERALLSCPAWAMRFASPFLPFWIGYLKKKKKSFPSDVLSAQNHYLFCTKRKLPEDRGLRLLCPRAQPKP